MSQYMDLDRIDMGDGNVGKATQPLGGMGRVEARARSTGAEPHRHFEVVEGSRHVARISLIRSGEVHHPMRPIETELSGGKRAAELSMKSKWIEDLQTRMRREPKMGGSDG